MSALSIFGVSLGTGSFALPTPDESLLRLRVYVITHAVPLLLLAAVSRERERAAAALRGSQARYQSVVEDQTELIARVRADGTYTFVNGQFCRYFQSSPETLIGDTFWQFAPVERRADVRAMMASLTPEHPVTTWSGTVLAPGGEPRCHEWTVRAFFDEEGRLLEFQGVGRDITSQKQVEEERRKLEEAVRAESIRHAGEGRFRTLADNAPVLIWMSGLQNEGIHFNKTWLDFTGRTLDQELGFGWVDSLHPDDRQRCQQICDEAFRRREPLAMQFRLRRHDGEYRWVLDNGIASYGLDGIFNGYVGTCVDITDQKLAQESLETAARNKDEFLAMLGHELRNPLAPMAAAVEVLRMSTPADESIAWAQDVLTRQLRQMTRLVDDLLDVSRVSRGTIRLNLEPLDMDRVVLEAIETSRPLLTERGHTLSIDLASQPMQLWGDSVRLVQVISNLLNNAANYTDPGGHIAVSVKRIGDRAELSVADNGIGIPEEMLERVFMMFTQAPGSNERSGGGLGIGLTLVDHLIGLHGGTVEARSGGLGRGSEFVVRLPLALDLLAAGADAQAEVGGFETPAKVGAAMLTGHPGARKRVLVVDDNADAAEGMARLLRALEHEVRVANDGMTALSAAEDFHPDVVLLDIGMPSMSGLEVARLIKENSGGKGPLLVATTGLGRGEDVRRSEAAGFDHHLIKPIDLERLASVLYG